jgi:hypothetical protein
MDNVALKEIMAAQVARLLYAFSFDGYLRKIFNCVKGMADFIYQPSPVFNYL